MRYTWTLPAVATLIAACASQPPVIENAPGVRPSISSSNTGAEINLTHESVIEETTIEAPIADVWRTLPAAWEDATIPIDGISNATRTLQSGRYRAPAKIVGKPLSEFLDCGYTLTGPRVTIWQVTMDVASAVVPDPAGARLATRVEATARPRDGTNTAPVTCSSRGELERIIAGNVNVRLGR